MCEKNGKTYLLVVSVPQETENMKVSCRLQNIRWNRRSPCCSSPTTICRSSRCLALSGWFSTSIFRWSLDMFETTNQLRFLISGFSWRNFCIIRRSWAGQPRGHGRTVARDNMLGMLWPFAQLIIHDNSQHRRFPFAAVESQNEMSDLNEWFFITALLTFKLSIW